MTENERKCFAEYDKTKAICQKALRSARARCYGRYNNRFQMYGARNIQVLLVLGELIPIAYRDKAYKMKRPHLHRFDNDGDYKASNVQFIEATKHSSITHTGRKRSPEARRHMSLAGGTVYGERHGNAILTYNKVRIIRTSNARGVDLAKRFGVSKSTISAVRKGRLWRK